MSSAYWRMLTLLREPENWYPRSILIEMVSTSVFITVLKMTTDRGSHTLSLLSLSRLLLLSRSAHDGRHISYVSTPTETETTHTGHFFLRQGRRRSKGAGDYLGPRTTLAVSRFPFYVRGVVRRFAFYISRSPFRVLHFSSLVSVDRPSPSAQSKRYTERNGGV